MPMPTHETTGQSQTFRQSLKYSKDWFWFN